MKKKNRKQTGSNGAHRFRIGGRIVKIRGQPIKNGANKLIFVLRKPSEQAGVTLTDNEQQCA
jgi:hypothetical protein